jgi:hypothetical protein
VDDGEVGDKNWVLKKISVTITKWKYPVYCGGPEIFGYAKDKKHDGRKVHDYTLEKHSLEHGEDYKYTHQVIGKGPIPVMLSSIVAPMLMVFVFEFYAVALFVLTLAIVANLARFARRHKKLFDKHLTDKDAHQQ